MVQDKVYSTNVDSDFSTRRGNKMMSTHTSSSTSSSSNSHQHNPATNNTNAINGKGKNSSNNNMWGPVFQTKQNFVDMHLR
ncbi:hypothetical protein Pcinc_040473 [Petrolisthes cinctipes]|uniref:Uncharacterized protein n=1 Tax=Petrolisthes cinctipes TaxID=88211 RepID=A0AAE1EJH9_PETCI|nr:hypothetical protein Pcinc_040473 [Petrolisthes cinctipes]